MKSFIKCMNNSVVTEQLAQCKVPASPAAKDSKKTWLFSRKASGSAKDDKATVGEDDKVEGLRVEFFLVVFLKFIASIVPGSK
jgi:ubiquitin-like-conjugating enzyme ATG3